MGDDTYHSCVELFFLEKFEKLRICPRPELEPTTKHKFQKLSYSGIAAV